MEKKIVTEISGNNSNELNNLLTIAGFRRSHRTAYRPACNFCNACIPVRINVSKYTPNRSQKRARKAALDLTCNERPPIATREQYDLFKDYQKLRHEESEMAAMDFNEFIISAIFDNASGPTNSSNPFCPCVLDLFSITG